MTLTLYPPKPETRRIGLAAGVAIFAREAVYADLAAARSRASLAAAAAFGEDYPELPPREQATRAEAAQDASANAEADALAQRLVTGWEGVVDISGAVVPWSLDAWRQLRDTRPLLAMAVIADLKAPVERELAEGNASAASPDGGGAAEGAPAETAPTSPEN